MPFGETPTRKKDDLDEFFITNLKASIEECEQFSNNFVVERSSDRFDITEDIIKSVFHADYVICDVSGTHSNPNVMYELGMRLSLSEKPLILIREQNPENKKIFDIQGFYTHEYSTTQYRKLEKWLIKKISDYENQMDVFQSPVLRILQRDPVVMKAIDRKRMNRLLAGLSSQFRSMGRAIGAAIDEFLESNNIKHEFSTPEETQIFLVKNIDELSNLDWSRFSFLPRITPAMNVFLSELPMEDY